MALSSPDLTGVAVKADFFHVLGPLLTVLEFGVLTSGRTRRKDRFPGGPVDLYLDSLAGSPACWAGNRRQYLRDVSAA